MPASQVFSGTGDPNGTVDGNPGDFYQDQTGKVWVNIAAPSTWSQLGSGAAAGSTGASPLLSVFGSFLPSAGSQYFDDLVTESDITKAMDAGGVTVIQRYDNAPDVGGERMLVQGVDGTWATVVFGQVNGASLGGGFGLYAIGAYTTGIFELRVKSNEGAPSPGNDWTEVIGMTNVSNAASTNAQIQGFYFHLNNARYGNGNWQCVVSDGAGAVAVVDTGVAADFGWHRFTITWDLATTTLKYYIGGVLVGTIDASTLGVGTPFQGNPMVSAGNTTVGESDQRDIQMDYFYGFVTLAR